MTPEIREYLRRDPVRNAFVLHDLAEEPERARFWLVRRGGRPVSHLLVYDSSQFGALWAHLAGEPDAGRLLLPCLPKQGVIVLCPPEMAGAVLDHVVGGRAIPEEIMVVERGEERLVGSGPAVRVPAEQAEEYARLVVPSIVPLSPALIERNRQHLAEQVVYGVFQEGALVSVAGTSVRTDDAWIVGGVVTLPAYRRRGYARHATSAVTRLALESAGRAGLWVDAANAPAIALYQELGYRQAGTSI